MESETNMKLRKIDFSGIKQNTAQWEIVRNQVLKALEHYGCFEATFDHIPHSILDSTMDAIKKPFDLPLQVKLQNLSNIPYHGYAGQHPAFPLYESLGIDDALSPGKIETFANMMWPEGNSSFSKSIRSFSEQLSQLDKTVRRMVLEGLKLDKYMDEHFDSTNYLVRVQKYDEPKSSFETEIALTSHKDSTIVTILYQNEVNGLEILTKDGHWIAAEPSSKNSFIVMSGDAFLAWTNGRLHSPFHKVMMKGDRVRYSIGLFALPKSSYMIAAPDEMVDEEHPLLFKPFYNVEYLDFAYSETGQRTPETLKAYCGV